jgi:hypothetical protein
MKATRVPVAIEAGSRRVFAFAVDWPGWCRAGRDESGALEALAACAGRYSSAAARAGVAFAGAGEGFAVVERLPGNATTDFGAPDAQADADRRPLSADAAREMAALVRAAHDEFDAAAAAAPAILRKGPRGGGRDRDAVVAHVIEAEAAYARRLGIPTGGIDLADPAALATLRRLVVELLAAARDGAPVAGRRWPPRYAARRIAWHALDHAWEIEDRSG